MIPLLLPLLMCKIFSQASKNCLAVPFSIQLCRKKNKETSNEFLSTYTVSPGISLAGCRGSKVQLEELSPASPSHRAVAGVLGPHGDR